jgi:hypothetical protein
MHSALIPSAHLLSTSAIPTRSQRLTAAAMQLRSRMRGSINTKLVSVISGLETDARLPTAQGQWRNCGGVRAVIATSFGVMAVWWLGTALVAALMTCGRTSSYGIDCLLLIESQALSVQSDRVARR